MSEALKLENQLCFPLYACAKGIIAKYKPFLDDIDLTYTQYIAMLALWERGAANVKALGESLFLDSGTLTPLLKKLESKGLVARERSAEDERNLLVTLTAKGERLKKKAERIPAMIGECVDISPSDARDLHRILTGLMARL